MPPRHHPRRSPKLPIRSQLIDGMGVNRPDVSLGRGLMWSLSRTRRSRAAGSGGFFGPPTLHRGPDEPQYFADHRRRNHCIEMVLGAITLSGQEPKFMTARELLASPARPLSVPSANLANSFVFRSRRCAVMIARKRRHQI